MQDKRFQFGDNEKVRFKINNLSKKLSAISALAKKVQDELYRFIIFSCFNQL